MDSSGALRIHGGDHPPEEILERYSMGRATDEECARIEEHLLVCASCRELLEESDRWVALMKAAAAAPAGPGGTEPFWKRFWGRAAGGGFGRFPLAALAGGIAVLAAVLWIFPSLPRAHGPQAVSLSALRGNELMSHARAGAPLLLRIEDSGNDPASVSIVNLAGKQVWSGPLRGSLADVPPLRGGTYWVRLFDTASSKQIKEYGLTVE
jgi:hypothetical protein